MFSRKLKNAHRRNKEFLMGVKNQWLVEDNLVPVYDHLVESYSEQLRQEWKVKDEVTSEIKQEVKDESSLTHQISPVNPIKVKM